MTFLSIYRTGVEWIVRGLFHLVLYRFVYLYVVNNPSDVFDLGDLLRLFLGTFALYLRVSGQFHLIVGLLLRRFGNSTAMIVATAIVFVLSWALHSYQWFWLRGRFLLTVTDVSFWAILGFLVVMNVVMDLKRPGRRSSNVQTGWHLRRGLSTLATFSAICVLWSLWSAESLVGWLWLWPAAANAEARHTLFLVAFVVLVVAVVGRSWGSGELPEAKAGLESHWRPLLRSSAIEAGWAMRALQTGREAPTLKNPLAEGALERQVREATLPRLAASSPSPRGTE